MEMGDSSIREIGKSARMDMVSRPRQTVLGLRMNSMVRTTHTRRLSLSTSLGILVGQGIIFGGYTPGDPDALDGMATYTLDDGAPIAFNIPATAVNKVYQPYFSIPSMEPGPHRLEVINKGNDSTTPLAFSYIYTKNAPASAQPASQPNRLSKIIGGAVGGGLGAILLVVLLVFGVIEIRKRRSHMREEPVLTPSAPNLEVTMPHSGVVSHHFPGPQGGTYMQESMVGSGYSHIHSPALHHHTPSSVLPQPSSVQHSSLHLPSPPPSYAALPSHPPLTFAPVSKDRQTRTRRLSPTYYPSSSTPPSQPEAAVEETPQTMTPPDAVDASRNHPWKTMDGKLEEYNPYHSSSRNPK